MERFPNSLIAFQRMFPDHAACAAWLASVRWPEGFECPRCGHDHGWALRGKAHTFECARCHRQTSVTAATILHGTKLDLTIWFWAAYLMATHSNGISALQLQKQLGIGCYRTAWTLAAKLRRAMVDPDRNLLSGRIEVDETALPFRTKHDPVAGGGGRSHDGKLLVVGAVEVGDGNTPGRLRLAEIASYGADSLNRFIGHNIAVASTAKTDGWAGYAAVPVDSHEPPHHRVHGRPRRAALDPSGVLQPQGLGTRRLSRPAWQTPAKLSRRVRLPLQPTPNATPHFAHCSASPCAPSPSPTTCWFDRNYVHCSASPCAPSPSPTTCWFDRNYVHKQFLSYTDKILFL